MAGERTLPGIGLRAYHTPGSNGWDATYNPDMRKLSAVVQCAVNSRLAAVPGSPSNGDIHILTAAPNLNSLAIRDNGSWVYIFPEEGWLAYDREENVMLRFTGTNWRVVIPVISGASAGQFLRVNLAGTEIETADIAPTVSLEDLTDVDLGTLVDGHVLTYDTGTGLWRNEAPASAGNLNGLSDVVINTPLDTHLLFYNGTNWINRYMVLDDNSDVVVSSPAAGQVLRFNGTSWVNDTIPGGGISDAPNDGTHYVRRNAGWEALPRNLSLATRTANYTLVLADAGTYVRMNLAGANTLTVPDNATAAFPTGTVIQIRQVGAGKTTVVAAPGVTVNSPSTLSARRQHSSLALIKVGTNEWDLTGDLE